jgi:hypothetical protein
VGVNVVVAVFCRCVVWFNAWHVGDGNIYQAEYIEK